MKNYIILGMPGSGKGTVSKKLVEDYGFIHLSTGDIIRKEQEKGSKIGVLADKLIDQGNFIPDRIVIHMFQQFIHDNPTDVGYLFDGFPRTKEQAKHIHAFLLKSKLPLTSVVYFDLKKETAIKRLLNRGKVEKRKDDTKEVITNRINVYNSKTKPLVKFFDEMGKLTKVDAEGDVETQYKNVIKAIEL